MRLAFFGAVFATSFTVASFAHADPTCIAAYEQTQTLRKDGKLVSAKAQAAICAHDTCPGLLSKDCSRWLSELEASTPTIVFEARTASGAERTDVRVKVDGVPLIEHLDGKAIALDPGSRTFLFEAEGSSPVERTVVVREGEKNRKVSIVVGGSARAEGAGEERPIPLGVWIFGGASIAFLVTSTIFAVDGFGKKSDLEACKPRCAPEAVDAMSTSFTLADVTLGAGLMAGAAAAFLFFTRPASSASPSVGTARPFVAPLPGGGAAGFSARF
ncbi:MAG: hypothetical protein KF819_26020 [Labilithrix sp.]|nr:hypothetical protein [Labilithrix sp.]